MNFMQRLYRLCEQKEDVDNTLYIITVIFNPNNYKSRYKLYNEFKPYIEFSGAKLLTVEVAFGDRSFQITKAHDPWNLQLRTNNELWHKEAGINAGFKHLMKLSPNAKYMGWFDADIRFSNPHWVRDTINALHRYHIVQPFTEAHNLNAKYESMWKATSSLKHFNDKLGYHQHPPIDSKYLCGGHPGLAWAARVSTFRHIGGLMDFCVAGSADTHMLNAMLGDVKIFYKRGMTQVFQEALQKWATRADEYIKRNIGYVNGICMHYWHGRSEQRGYEKRWDIMNFHQFNPETDIVRQPNGLYAWAGNKPQLEQDLRKSMSERNEDSID
jgi:hypothetical protein